MTVNTEAARVSDDRRKHRRVHLPLPVKFILPDNIEHTGQIMNISAGDALIETKASTEIGTKVLIYVKQLGRLECTIIRTEETGFAVKFDAQRAKVRRITDTLIWLFNDAGEYFNRRRADRIRQDKPVTAHLSDGSQVPCKVIDISVTGASIEINPPPAVNSIVNIGKMKGRVIRHHQSGVGIEFVQQPTRKNR
ncbi:MAG: PilZ domain-containing protein [Aquisalinus sp.]|nr:PilZ domain-containing protein [Aquisalinus sp.]